MSFRRRALIAAAALAGLSVVAVAVAWAQRRPIAKIFIDDYLEDRGVAASYDLVAVGTKRQRLENLVIGNPAQPDLTVELAEIDVATRLSGATIKAVRAKGVRLHGRLIDGKLSLGAIDKLLPPPSNEPFSFPDIDIALSDARGRLDLPEGALGARFDGMGNLARDFSGQIALVAPKLSRAKCAVSEGSAVGTIGLHDRDIRFRGPVRLGSATCSGIEGRAIESFVELTTDRSFDQFSGLVKLGADRIGRGAVGASRIKGDVNFTYRVAEKQWGGFSTFKAQQLRGQGLAARDLRAKFDFIGTADKTSGKFDGQIAGIVIPKAKAGKVQFDGVFDGGLTPVGGLDFVATGMMAAKSIVPDRGLLTQFKGLKGAGGGTPLAPLTEALSRDLLRLEQGGDLDAHYDFETTRRGARLALSALRARSASGVRLAMNGREPIIIGIPGKPIVSGALEISGGGLPASRLVFDPAKGPLAGTATIAPYQAGGARLALSSVRFTYGRGGLSLDAQATVNGPLGNGRVTGLSVPLAVRGGTPQLSGCMPVNYQSLTISGFALTPGKIDTCLEKGGATVNALRVAGHYNGQNVNLSAQRARIGFARGDFNANGFNLDYGDIRARSDGITGTFQRGSADFSGSGLKAQMGGVSAQTNRFSGRIRGGRADFETAPMDLMLGDGKQTSRFSTEGLKGQVVNGVASGTFGKGGGQIFNVPLRMYGAEGNWRFAGGVLDLTGAMGVADTNLSPRFNPLVSDGFKLRVANGKVTASGPARERETGALVTNVSISHNIAEGTGEAELDVPGITFKPGIQPEQMTPLTIGVIAEVKGTVAGKGRINWGPKGVKSTGRFETSGLDLAAAFGQVTGLKGELQFTDLLGLESAPGQIAKMGTINPGILVQDGEVRYQLIAGQKVRIEGGRWPLAGGFLILDPTILDLSEQSERRLTFRVEGMDAARFIAQMQFENISAIGTFDGVLPMIFDKNGGRIEGGSLVVRPGGGTLSYIGEVSRENLGAYGSIAFDALKSMKFDRLTIDLAGPLDGEMVSQIKFNGINQLPVTPGRAQLPLPIKVKGLSGIRFIFNITIKAPFRSLIWMARTFEDPSLLIQDQLEKERRRKEEEERRKVQEKDGKPVQPSESEPKP